MSRSLPHLGAMLTGRGTCAGSSPEISGRRPQRRPGDHQRRTGRAGSPAAGGGGGPGQGQGAGQQAHFRAEGLPRHQGAHLGGGLRRRHGERLFQRSGSRATMPASNTKIVTAAAAMRTLGPDYRFRTQVIRRAKITGSTLDGRLYLKGYGDPTARVSDYAVLAQRVRAAGIRTVTGSWSSTRPTSTASATTRPGGPATPTTTTRRRSPPSPSLPTPTTTPAR